MAGTAPLMGFGASFYGFFVAAAVWLLFYFLWAFAAARRDRRRGIPDDPGHPGTR